MISISPRKKLIYLLLIFGFTATWNGIQAQSTEYGSVAGTILDANSQPISFAVISLLETQLGATTDENGYFSIKSVPEGDYQLQLRRMGFEAQIKSISILPNKLIMIDIVMIEKVNSLGEVVLTAKSRLRRIEESGYNVAILQSKEYQNLSLDVNSILENTTGINLRESGGLGSGFDLSLNGLSGNQIRYFIDGIPMENFGPSLSLNNFPINLVENVEVYKGVVPIHLGADALGGAINIISASQYKSYLDLSYSYGSFNTHRISLSARKENVEKGFYLQTHAFFNHSDNDYEMDSVKIWDLELGNFLGYETVNRFHDHYTSGMINVQGGIKNKKFADQLNLNLTASRNRKRYQHPDNNILRVFGQFHTKGETYLASGNYQKSFNKFSIFLNSTSGFIRNQVIDTSAFKYNWTGDFIRRASDDPKGELYERRSLFTLDDYVWRSNIGGSYRLSNNQNITLNFVHSHLWRSGEDQVDSLNRSFIVPNNIQKYILGIDYSISSRNDDFEASLFSKAYRFAGKIVVQDFENNDIISKPSFQNIGYGLASRWRIKNGLLAKLSFEHAYRLPEPYEILGDGIYVNVNPNLQPEQSYNLNVGLSANTQFQEWLLQMETNYFLRLSEDFIRFLPLGPFGEYENLTNVKSQGIEGSLKLSYRKFLSISGNITWQNITDQNERDDGLPNINYKSRIPNIPYLFANTRLGIMPIHTNRNQLNLFYSVRFVESFFLNWENLGNANTKNIIPQQLTHHLDLEYALEEGKYNFSFSVVNLTDAVVFDNFSIQLPGRAFYLKFRCFIH